MSEKERRVMSLMGQKRTCAVHQRCPLCANSVQTVMPASRPSCSSLNDHSWNGWSCFWLIQSFKRAT